MCKQKTITSYDFLPPTQEEQLKVLSNPCRHTTSFKR